MARVNFPGTIDCRINFVAAVLYISGTVRIFQDTDLTVKRAELIYFPPIGPGLFLID
ncbi:MAG: hypothetical protein RBG13Loki_3640 [Promethearchaeota archaeon CR_4]|nr:MAG: hypothetical protein RBG13Loki_3640 [Candidatus Lokiarchaeota archaeon CR_4]